MPDTHREEKKEETSPRVLFHAQSFERTHPLPDYRGDVCVVTGGTTGIGESTCQVLLEAGAKAVYNIDIAKPVTQEYETECSRLHFVKCDVSMPSELKAAINAIVAIEGKIDHLVSNAGVWVCGEQMENITEEEFDRVVGINIKGCFFAISSVVPHMKKQEKGGSIIVVGSDQSFVGKPYQNLYGMTKGAIAQLAKSTAVQYAPEGIRVNCVCPGTIDTPLMRKAVKHMTDLAGDGDVEGRVKWLETAQPFPRLGHPEEVAHTIAFVSKMPFMVGSNIQIDGGYTAA